MFSHYVCETDKAIYTGMGRSRFTVISMQNTEFILVLLFCLSHMNDYKPTFANCSVCVCVCMCIWFARPAITKYHTESVWVA